MADQERLIVVKDGKDRTEVGEKVTIPPARKKDRWQGQFVIPGIMIATRQSAGDGGINEGSPGVLHGGYKDIQPGDWIIER